MKNSHYLSAAIFLLLTISSNIRAETNSTEFNRQLVISFYNEVIIKGKTEAVDKYISNTYIQHNPAVADGKQALKEFIDSFPVGEEPTVEIIRTIAENDLVVVHVKDKAWPGPRGGAIMDIFRVEQGMIAEHWDVIQAIPETSANTNTMF